MKFLTIFSIIFMPLTVLTGLYGMNVPLRALPRRRAPAVLVDSRHHGDHLRSLLWLFRRSRWL